MLVGREPERARLDALLQSARDDGVGGADATGGTGLRGLADRVEALGGSLLVTSRAGTVISAELPCSPGSTDSRGASSPWITARNDRPSSKGTHREDARPIAPAGAHDNEAATDDR